MEDIMKRVKTVATRNLACDIAKSGCGECQTSCQSASKTSCSVANQKCEQKRAK
jgi:predicted ribosomally synthesized six-cysteine peptide SCIFF